MTMTAILNDWGTQRKHPSPLTGFTALLDPEVPQKTDLEMSFAACTIILLKRTFFSGPGKEETWTLTGHRLLFCLMCPGGPSRCAVCMKPLLEKLSDKGITYNWGHPFHLIEHKGGHSYTLWHPSDVPAFLSALELPPMSLPNWLSFVLTPSNNNPAVNPPGRPQLSRHNHRSQRRRSQALRITSPEPPRLALFTGLRLVLDLGDPLYMQVLLHF